MSTTVNLKARQEAAVAAYDKMLGMLIDYSPCGKLTVDDVKTLARVVQTICFEATEGFAK